MQNLSFFVLRDDVVTVISCIDVTPTSEKHLGTVSIRMIKELYLV